MRIGGQIHPQWVQLLLVVLALSSSRWVSSFMPPSSVCKSKRSFVPRGHEVKRSTRVCRQLHTKLPRRNSRWFSTLFASTTSTETKETASSTTVESPPEDWKEQVNEKLSQVIDPDLNADIVTLNFVKNLTLNTETSTLTFDLELTTPACPVKDLFVSQCQELVTSLPFITAADITLTAQPTRGETTEEFGLTRVSSIIAVSSCKGGVGKSTTAVNLAYALQRLGARVGIFDADVYGPSLPTMITPDDDAVRFVGRQISPLTRNNVKLMSFGYVNDGAAVMRGPMVSQLLDQFLNVVHWGELDYLVLDMPPGTGDIQLTLSQRLNITAAVIVTTPQELSFADVVRGIDMFDSVNVPCIAVVENMAYYEVEKNQQTNAQEEVGSGDNSDMEELKSAFVAKLEETFQTDENTTNGLPMSNTAAEKLAQELMELVQTHQTNTNKQDSSSSTTQETEQVRIFGKGHLNRLSTQFGIDHAFSVPLLSGIAQSGDSGNPFILTNDDEDTNKSRHGKVYHDLANAVVTEVAKIKFGKNQARRLTLEFDEERHLLVVGGISADATAPTETSDANDSQEQATATTATLTPAELRRECKCAACVEEMTGRQILNKQSISELIRPTKMEPCGNYAVSVNWSDGHRSLYPYRQIRAILNDGDDVEKGRN